MSDEGMRHRYHLAELRRSIGLCSPLADCHVIADMLEIDGRAADAACVRDAIADFPRATWNELSRPMRDALLVGVRGRVWAPRVQTVAALERRGLAHDWRHTAEGLAVRDYAREIVGLPAEDPAHVYVSDAGQLLLPETERSQAVK